MADPEDLAGTATDQLLHAPGLVIITGPPGSGRSTVLRAAAARAAGPVFTGGGLAMLRGVPALALSRAVRARLPGHDVHLLAEAVRSRVKGGLLVLDDLQYADPATLAAVALIGRHCRVLAALRTPHRLDEALLAGAVRLDVPPLGREAALDLARRAGGPLDEQTLAAVADRAGGNPLAISALARQAAAGRAAPGSDIDQVAYAIATALADLPRPARTALAALGLLGRPAPAALLGPGAADLTAAGLVHDTGDGLVPTSTYVAETAAGLLDADARTDLHRRLAELTPPAEAARHLAAAGEHRAAFRAALTAADATGGGDRAALLLFACDLPVPIDPRVRIAAADAALTAGRPRAAAAVLDTGEPLGLDADVLRGEALLQAGLPAQARDTAGRVPDAAPAPVLAARDRVLLLAELALDPASALDTADKISARHPSPPPGVAAALAAVHAAHRTDGWAAELAGAAANLADKPAARAAAWLLVETLAADGRLAESAAAARTAAAACRADLAYGWETRFLAAADWAIALHGAPLPPATAHPASSDPISAQSAFSRPAVSEAGGDPRLSTRPAAGPAASQLGAGNAPDSLVSGGSASGGGGAASGSGDGRGGGAAAGGTTVGEAGVDDGPDAVLRRAANLADRSLPDDARAYATAATALVEADTGLLAAARARLGDAPAHPATAWVGREAAWLDGQPDRATTGGGDGGPGLLAGLAAITGRWASYDLGAQEAPPIPPDVPAAARRTLLAWATGTGFAAAAAAWTPTALREQIRCLLAAGLHETVPARAIDALLAAERLADAAGLTVLAGRARRGLRRHNVQRDTRSPRSGSKLTNREVDVLRLVAAGEPTRRIAGQLGISAETVDTHIRAGMRKLGARTRTEAAALAFTPDLGEVRR
ncbi:LuxR C-terminal-related transcriptional regulator [Actinoplanes sp. NPDC049265]|uniref:LuxR C-terminal-related transcriptional regulator n=1 Tax=Actinoplanes sp. NPDC049265 TaxID=3363902 RepID=UPI00371B67A7